MERISLLHSKSENALDEYHVAPGLHLTRNTERAAEAEQTGRTKHELLHRLRASLEFIEPPLDRLEYRIHAITFSDLMRIEVTRAIGVFLKKTASLVISKKLE
jgi:hypothetical protein